MVKKRGLGRGLDALLGIPGGVGEAAGAGADAGEFRNLPVECLQRGRYQPRTHIEPEALEGLAQSIRSRGIVQPIVVRPLADGQRYEIVAGERRWRAAQQVGLGEVPVVVRELPDDAALAIALIENIQREDLNPVEEAQALRRLADEFSLTHADVAEAVGRSRASVSNLLRLLELEPDVRELLEAGHLEMGHARALLALASPQQREAARRIIDDRLSVREAEELVRSLREPARARPGRRRPAADPDTERLCRELGERIGARVEIRSDARGKGVLSIHFSSLEALDGVLERLQ